MHDRETRIGRLPKWAQDHIETLQREVEAQKRTIWDIGPSNANGSDTSALIPGIELERRNLPNGTRILFRLGAQRLGRGNAIQVHTQAEDGYVRVQADSSLFVRPEAANCVHLFMDPTR